MILGMSEPVTAVHLTWRHSKERRWTTTTAVVVAYLLLSVGGRLSVAVFGLTFDLNEASGVEYPVMIANWNASLLQAPAPPDPHAKPHVVDDEDFIITDKFQNIISKFDVYQTHPGTLAVISIKEKQHELPLKKNVRD